MTAVVLDDLASLELNESNQAVYDRPIRLRELYRDPDSGAEHYVVRYPAGLRGRRHKHSAAHTIVVLAGAMEIDGGLLEGGSYAHHPADTVMHHQAAPGRDCLFVIIFHGPFDVTVVDG